jgi:hypothetical protein
MVRIKFNDLRLVVQLASSSELLDLLRSLHQRGSNGDLLRTCLVRVTEDRKRQRRVRAPTKGSGRLTETYEAVMKSLYNRFTNKTRG